MVVPGNCNDDDEDDEDDDNDDDYDYDHDDDDDSADLFSVVSKHASVRFCPNFVTISLHQNNL